MKFKREKDISSTAVQTESRIRLIVHTNKDFICPFPQDFRGNRIIPRNRGNGIYICFRVRYPDQLPVDPETILKDAANGVEGLSYKVESSSEAFASRAAGDVYYQMVVSFRGYESANGIISRGTLTFNFEPSTDGDGYKYTANGNGLVVASSTDASTRRTDAEGLAGTVKGFSFKEDGTVSVTTEFAVVVDKYKGNFTSGRDKVTIAESEGVVSGGNGTADSPFIISDLEPGTYAFDVNFGKEWMLAIFEAQDLPDNASDIQVLVQSDSFEIGGSLLEIYSDSIGFDFNTVMTGTEFWNMVYPDMGDAV